MLFEKRYYKLSDAVGGDNAVPVPVNTVLDIRTGPDLIDKRSKDPAWPPCILPVQNPKPLDASDR